MKSRWNREEGSAAVELGLAIPLIAVVLAFIVIASRGLYTNQTLQTVANSAARAASLEHDVASARQAALRAADAALAVDNLRCSQRTVEVTGNFSSPLGVPATATVTVTCTMPTFGVAGLPGTMTWRATMSSPIDTYRER